MITCLLLTHFLTLQELDEKIQAKPALYDQGDAKLLIQDWTAQQLTRRLASSLGARSRKYSALQLRADAYFLEQLAWWYIIGDFPREV